MTTFFYFERSPTSARCAPSAGPFVGRHHLKRHEVREEQNFSGIVRTIFVWFAIFCGTVPTVPVVILLLQYLCQELLK